MTADDDRYAAAGVNITAGNRAVNLMTSAVQSTYNDQVLAGIGAFGGMFDASQLKTMHHPILVASIDGVGTKVALAAQTGRFTSLGYDLVHHSVNDILVQGARPLFFLDYLATSQLNPEQAAQIVTGMADACRAVNCVLLGGETAEMPDVYAPKMLDVAGSITGVVDSENRLPKNTLQAGDVLLGIASSGPHTNGYSLIRKIIAGMSLDAWVADLNSSLADALLAPHRCYLNVLQPALNHPEKPIKALIHITGGGFIENIPRILPNNLAAEIQLQSWNVPPLFQWLQRQGEIPLEQMYRVFNMGIGMLAVVSPQQVHLLKSLLQETTWEIGCLIPGSRSVRLS